MDNGNTHPEARQDGPQPAEPPAEETTPASNKPAGGFDATPFPHAPPGYTLKFTFHRAMNLPLGDISTLSSDPYMLAILSTDLPRRHKQDPNMVFRTPIIRREINPEWNCEWVVANVPASGFHLKCRLYDADRANHDDRLGSAYIDVDHISETWEGMKEEEHKIRKRMGSLRAYFLSFVVSIFSSKETESRGTLVVSVECLGRTPGEEGGQLHTVGPNQWRQHFSPLIGRLVGVKEGPLPADGQRSVTRYNFQSIQMQLKGPVPPQLYHRYVEFRPIIKGMFTSQTLRGRLLNHTLHHQHARIYNYDRQTRYGLFSSPSVELTKQFLEFVHYDLDGRVFTYVITLDGEWRFTETGKEFGVDMLSKHTLHSDVSIYVAYAGEFLVRRTNYDYRRKRPRRNRRSSLPHAASDSSPPRRSSEGPASHQPKPSPSEDVLVQPTEPSMYELFIDNDSGTYRPNAELLPLLKEFLSSSLPGLHITTLDCQKDAKRMSALKEEQRERKNSGGRQMAFVQRRSGSFSSLSSSEEEQLDERTGMAPTRNPVMQRARSAVDVKARFKEWLEKSSPKEHVHHDHSGEKQPDGDRTAEREVGIS